MMPLPLHERQGCENENIPWLSAVDPRPPHAVHVFGEVPARAPEPEHDEHCASAVRCNDVVRPCAASTKSSVSVVAMSCPRCGPVDPPPPRRPPPPRPNIWPRMSPSPSPPMSKRMFCPPPPGPPKPPIGPTRRTSSYSARFFSSPTTSYAAEMSLNFSSAFALSGFASGWYSRASFRYAFVMSLTVASFDTPSTA